MLFEQTNTKGPPFKSDFSLKVQRYSTEWAKEVFRVRRRGFLEILESFRGEGEVDSSAGTYRLALEVMN